MILNINVYILKHQIENELLMRKIKKLNILRSVIDDY